MYWAAAAEEYWFRTRDLLDFLFVTKQFRYYTPQEVHGILKEMKCTYKKINTESRKQLRVALLARKNLEYTADPEVFNPDFSKYTETDDF